MRATEKPPKWEYRLALGKVQNIHIFREGDARSAGCVAMVPLRDGKRLVGLNDAALIAAAPALRDILKAILAEVDGPPDSTPYSADSYLPSCLVDQAKVAIASIQVLTG